MKLKRWRFRRNADEVKVALVGALGRLGVKGIRTEITMHGLYGSFRVDVAIQDLHGKIVAVAEAKRFKGDLSPRQRTNYATCGVPAFLCHTSNVQEIAIWMAAFVMRREYPSSAVLITSGTYAGAADREATKGIQQRFERRILRG